MRCRARLSAALLVVLMTVILAVNCAPMSQDPLLSQEDERRHSAPEQISPDRRVKVVGETHGLDRRDKMVKMLAALEELNKSINRSLSSRIILMPRANVRGSGKKNKVVTSEEGQRASTAPPVDDGGTTSQAGDNPSDRNPAGGKGMKKSASQPAKKASKRVCFWKYCSQN